MTNVEISIIVIAALIPIIALVMFLPRLKKIKAEKSDNTPSPAPVVEEKPVEDNKSTEEQKPVQNNNPRELFNASYNSDDFKGYLTDKSKRTDRPTKKEFYFEGGELDDDFFDDFDFGGPKRKKPAKNEEKSISEQIQELSPELKALILTGVLDKKDY